MVKRTLRLVGGLIGSLLVLLGLIGSAVSVLALIDPVGTKAADDSDPFGVPPSFLESLGVLGSYLAIGGLGVYLLWLLCRRRPAPI